MSNETKKYELVKSEKKQKKALRFMSVTKIIFIFYQSTGNCLTRKEKKHQYRQFWAIITAWLRQSQITI